jgi:hypothetical protein
MLGSNRLSRDGLDTGQVNWRRLTPHEWAASDEHPVAEMTFTAL